MAASFLLSAASRAQAPASSDASCEAVEQTEAMRAQGQYRKARAVLLECVNAQCGGDVRRRCAATLQRLDAVTPSIVVRAEDPSGNDLTDVAVSLGDERLVSSLDGMAIPVDPGEHRFVFTREGEDPVVQTVNIEQGQKFRAIDVVVGSAPKLALPPAAEAARDVSSGSSERVAAAATLLGVGVIGVTSFTVLGLRARSGEEALERCKPNCSEGRVESVKMRYLLSNVSIGVGALALAGATWLLLSGPSDTDVADPADRGLAVGADATGAFATYSGRF
ncbi:MAG TPA: hypothetical protein VMG12_32705 [Polyangiaceae bacterium]|nr:hypothetical protein [Polyangiaceae bacterium]